MTFVTDFGELFRPANVSEQFLWNFKKTFTSLKGCKCGPKHFYNEFYEASCLQRLMPYAFFRASFFGK